MHCYHDFLEGWLFVSAVELLSLIIKIRFKLKLGLLVCWLSHGVVKLLSISIKIRFKISLYLSCFNFFSRFNCLDLLILNHGEVGIYAVRLFDDGKGHLAVAAEGKSESQLDIDIVLNDNPIVAVMVFEIDLFRVHTVLGSEVFGGREQSVEV